MIIMDVIALLARLALILVVLSLYWLPSIVGYFRHVQHIFSVVVTNALLGWTVIGWLVSLFMALRTPGPSLSKPPATG
jgi:Superinfection immunity protein